MAPWSGYEGDLARLAVYGLGVAAYTLAVIALYVPMSTRMMFARRFGERQVATVGRRFAYVLLFPVLSFLFFLLVAGSMVFLGDFTDAEASAKLLPTDIMTIAMGIVLAIRVCAYFSEEAAKDLARVMPLGLLGVVLVTNSVSDLRTSLDNMRAFAAYPDLLVLFFGIVVIVEFFLRGVYELLGRPRSAKSLAPPKR